VANRFRDAFVAAAAADFQGWTLATAITGGVLVLAGVVAGLIPRRRAQANR
jgi:hypothetical protein